MRANNETSFSELAQNKQYWCHSCRCKFLANLLPGVDQIKCPRCSKDFCQLFLPYNKPHKFQPYQKPIKQKHHKIKRTKKIITSEIVRQALEQLASDSQAVKVRQITPQIIQSLKIIVDNEVQECIICKEEIKIGDEGLLNPCKHIFHVQCLSQWLSYKNSCPKCRQKVLQQFD